jgi:uncharacterized protein YfbU (UPF0304 family)
VLNLTDVERRILINQSRILAALYPLESNDFERTAEILAEGFHEGWQEAVLKGLKTPLLKEEMNFVFQVLAMYDWLQKSYYALSLEDKLHLQERTLVFPGFEPRTERRELTYAHFLLENLDRFSFTEVAKPLNAHRPMRHIYTGMLDALPNDNRSVLCAAQLKAIGAYASAEVEAAVA